MLIKAMLMALAILNNAGAAKTIALHIYVVRAEEIALATFGAEARRFEHAFRKNPDMRAISVRAEKPEELEAELDALTIGEDEKISRVLFHGHGSRGVIGAFPVLSPAVWKAFALLSGKFADDLIVHLLACKFVAKEIDPARKLIEYYLRHMAVRRARVFAYHGSPSVWLTQYLEPFWKFEGVAPKIAAGVNQFGLFGLPVASLGAALMGIYGPALFAICYSSTIVIMNAGYLAKYPLRKIAYAFDLDDGRASVPIEIDMRSIRREFYDLECDRLLDGLVLP